MQINMELVHTQFLLMFNLNDMILRNIFSILTAIFTITLVNAQVMSEHLELNKYNNEPKIQALKSIKLLPGFNAKGTVLISIAQYPTVVSSPTYNQNFIITRTFLKSGVTMQNLNAERAINEENRSFTYFDEKGRAKQTVDLMASPSFADIVRYSDYDEFGRESVKYLPYADSKTNIGSFVPDASVKQRKFYKSSNLTDTHVNKTDFPFSIMTMENSPLNRTIEQGKEGASWQPEPRVGKNGHTSIVQLGVNDATDEVKLWVLNGTVGAKTNGKFHEIGSLQKTISKDENWVMGKAGIIEEFKNLFGNTLLKRIWKTETEKLDTYFIYNDFDDLCYVVTPKYTDITISDNNDSFNGLIYAIKYDKYHRAIRKKVPGKGWEYFVYNNRDQIVYSRSAEQVSKGEWNFVKYDALGRTVISGIEKGHIGDDQQALANNLDSYTGPLYEVRENKNDGYTNNSLPKISTNSNLLVVNYYDDYNDIPSVPFIDHSDYSTKIKGLLTASKTKILGGTEWLWVLNHYDDEGQITNIRSTNHLGGSDNVSNTYSFTGDLLKSVRVHDAKGISTTLITTNSYDHVGRLIWSKLKTNGQAEVIMTKNEYNEVGQLKKKLLGGDSEGKDFVTAVDITYNERGWLKEKTSPQFSFSLKYDDASDLNVAQFDGSIAQQEWLHKDQPSRTATYTYDKLKRLLDGNVNGYMREEINYDEIGNIKWLKRDGGLTNYSYENNGMSTRLSSLSGIIKGNYTYDLNGNATKDRTGMQFNYNYLNLPVTASGGSVKVDYQYDAAGVRLRKISSTQGTRDYVGGIEYGAQGIERIGTSEGYMLKSGSDYVNYYNLTDNLGNVRAVVYRNPSNSKIEVIQRQDYYPFGKTKQILAGGNNKYLYNGKEVQEELGGQLDYGARFYDAEVGRWNVIDPKYNLYYSTSPYAYVSNNPIYFLDVNGEFAGTITGLITGAIFGAIDSYLSDVDFTPSVVRGALAGAAAGAAADLTVGTFGTGPAAMLGAGVVSGVVGSAASQFMSNSTISLQQTAIDGAVGGAFGYAGSKAAPYVRKGAQAVGGYMEGQVAKMMAPAATEMVESFSQITTKGNTLPSLNNVTKVFRTMPHEASLIFDETGHMPAGTETMVSTTRFFSRQYQGVKYEIDIKPGTIAELEAIGVRDDGNINPYKHLPKIGQDWMKENAYFKTEGNQVNIGLGYGKALKIFNENITNFKKYK